MSKRILSLMLALAMVIGMTVPTVFADETESTTPVAEPTFGSDIAAAADAMEFPEEGGEVTKYCPACKEEVLWKPVSTTGTTWINDDTTWAHYYVPTGISMDKASGTHGSLIETGSNFCLHLNGKTIEAKKTNVFTFGSGVANLMGKGTVIGNPDSTRSATINITYSAEVHLYGGTYTKGENSNASAPTILMGSANKGTLNIYGNTVIDGADILTSALSGAVTLGSNNCKINMYDGTITGGNSSASGGNVRITGGEFNMYGGTISNGTITSGSAGNAIGGNVFVNGGEFNMYGGELAGTEQTMYHGGNLAVYGGVCTIDGGSITGGTATYRGGNVYVSGGQFIMKSGTISGGTATRGGNIGIYSAGTAAISGGSITNGEFYMDVTDAVTLSGNPVISELSIPSEKTIIVGDMTYGASVGINGSRILSSNGGLQEEAQYFYGTVATGDVVVVTKTDGKLSYSPAKLPASFDTKAGTAYCAACGKDVTWSMGVVGNTDGTFNTWNASAGSHGYLAASKTISPDQITNDWSKDAAIYSKVDACFHLNGKTLTTTGAPAIWVNTANANLTILGSGTVCGKAAANYNAGAISITNGATINLMGGTYTKAQVDSKISSVLLMGTSYVGVINIYNGAVIDGQNADTAGVAGAVHLANENGVINMYGGTIKNGKSNGGAGNLYVNKGTFNMYGGSIVDGVLTTGAGGDVSVNTGTLNLYSGVCEDLRMLTANISVKEGFIGDVDMVYTSVTDYTNGMELPGTSTGAIGEGLTIAGTAFDVYAKNGKLYTCSHDWQDATCDAPKTCKDCGKTEGKALEHVFNQRVVSEEYFATAATCVATDAYYLSCVCGEAHTKTFASKGAVAAHTPEEVEGQEATHAAPGYKSSWYCPVCRLYYVDQECTTKIGNAASLATWQTTGSGKLPQVAHTFDQKVASDDFKASNATCEAAATYYYSCTCGIAGTETFESGDLLEHSYTGENGACVNGCGKTACENGDHNWGEEIEAKAATCTEKGNIAYYDCANCELYAVGEDKTITAWNEIEIAIDANAHKYGNWVEVDETTHKHVCVYNEEHVETADHVYENGACVCGKEEPVVEDKGAQVGDQKFDTLQDALEAVKETGGEIKLLKETVVVGSLRIPNKVTLDLAGQKLTVSGEDAYVLACYTDSFITDSSADNSGRLVADISQLRMLENNTQLPVKMADGIMFVNATSGNQKKAEKNYQCWIDSADAALINALKAGKASELALEFQVAITWGNNVLKYTFKDETVATYMQNWQTHAMFLKITGAESIADLKYQARIVFADDTKGEVIVWAGDVVNHN